MGVREQTSASRAELRPECPMDEQVALEDRYPDTGDVSGGTSAPGKRKRRWRESSETGSKRQLNGAAGALCDHVQMRDKEATGCAAGWSEHGLVEDETNGWTEMSNEGEGMSDMTELADGPDPTLSLPSAKEADCSANCRVDGLEKVQGVSTTDDVLTGEEAASSTLPLYSQAVSISGKDTVCANNKVPIKSYPSSGDESVKPMHVESSPRQSNYTVENSPHAGTSASTLTSLTLGMPAEATDSAPARPVSYAVGDSATATTVKRVMGRRKRSRRKLSCLTSQRRATAKTRLVAVPAVSAFEGKPVATASGDVDEDDNDFDTDSNLSASPVYPAVDASHLYSSTLEGTPWQWENTEPYFDHLAQSDLDNLLRWGQENADFVAANPQAWRGVPAIEGERAVLETMAANVSCACTAHVEFPVGRGRRYLDVWEEADFLLQQKRDGSVKEVNMTTPAKMKGNRKGANIAEESLLVSHRDLVYGYDDDLFREFSDRLACRANVCQFNSHLATPLSSLMTRRENATRKVGENDTPVTADETASDDLVLPSFPIRQLHPASLGLWKLRTKVEPDFAVVHPACVNRSQVPARWKEERERHQLKQHEMQCLQADELADLNDEDDKGGGHVARNQHRVTIPNCSVSGELPSFGNCVEDDEVSRAIATSMRTLVSLSFSNWRTAQLVYERATCSIQCASILEGEAATARELEDLFLQLCPPSNVDVDAAVLPGSRRPWASRITSTPHDMIAYCVRNDVLDSCSFAVAASVEFALRLGVGDVVDVLDKNGCWKHGEVVEVYSDDTSGVAKFLLIRLALCPDDTVEWIASSEGRILPQGVADGTRSCSVGPTRAHRVRVRFDQSLARELERSLPHRRTKQAAIASQLLARRQHDTVVRTSNDLQKTPQKRKRKRPAKLSIVATAAES
ncbi:unnamed protein product [Hyaloperonospora brassicae]|uniref:Uncharacterized protein n=1 Tax=Hyaloperonospora brassicae TaxID=162125 RepID=A0AAV0UQ33_HYABA|nr:unnamed protein product [Hyaloperonospora brassicae]